MPIRKFKPVTSASRFRSVSAFDEITRKEPEKSLTEGISKKAGRNHHGRVTSRRPVLMVDDLVSSTESAYNAWWRMKNNEKMKISDYMFAIIQKHIKQNDPGIDKPMDYTGTKDMVSEDTYSIKTINLFYLDDFSVGDIQVATKVIVDGIEKHTN